MGDIVSMVFSGSSYSLMYCKLVNSLKSVSSRKLRQEFLAELEKTYYQKKVVWNSSYFLASCGGVTISTLRKYIENQDKPIS